MSVVYVLVPVVLLVVLAAVLAYRWAARHGQFDDLSTPPLRMLHDHDVPAGRKAETAPGQPQSAEETPPRPGDGA
jgi:cbb3-type cytochrome oxidase maturation protein